ncbi:hypothetical protein QYE76_026734 [Lolium multiflorum]|uniref:Protein kinase domain-containing protein n=1 Tax=Lolium multiflorum TaxID=4521 RepID=A0AAD8RHV0_LOLMU|nr:hypothetical protein QYE76_026734 [Lolium multiflorum]
MATMASTILLLIVLHLLSVATAQRQPSVALPGCPDRCGNITVPYPFGIGPDCYRYDGLESQGFQLECDDTGPSPPRLTFFGHSDYSLAKLSLATSEVTVYVKATPTCFNFTSGLDGGDTEAYTSVDKNVYRLSNNGDIDVPLVLDWAVRDLDNCSAARNTEDFACRSTHSNCFDVTKDAAGSGYGCNCSTGYDGNPYLKGGCTGVSVGVILLGSMCCCLCLARQKSKLIRTKQKFFEHNGGVILQQQMQSYGGTTGGPTGGFKIFSTEELKKATNNFAADQILGRGGHGIVYRGVLADDSVVAIKKSKMMEETETKEFTREMLILSQINHRNVVKLLGCCLEVEVPMLVYEYVSNGTLYQYIHGGKGLDANTALDTRLRIAAESAEALAYMHTSASPPILHGDVKTANILLNSSLTAKVTDFGASKLAPNDEAEIATLVQGTCGYLDPEYLMTCKLTDKSDVYSFGVVLLELLTRKKVLCFDGPEENMSLVSRFVIAVKAGRHGELMDDGVRKGMGREALEEVSHLLTRCVSMNGEERPGMKEIAERLEALRRYQQHPWGQSDGADSEEEKSLLGRKQQRDADYKFRPHDVLDLEGGSTHYFSV